MKINGAIAAVIVLGSIIPFAARSANGSKNLVFQTKDVHEVKDGYWDAKASYPVFAIHSPVLEYGSAQLEAHAHNLIAGFLKDAPGYLVNNAKPTDPFALDSSFTISYSSKDLLSLNLSTYEDVGGAHPNTELETYNFGVVHGKAKKLGIQDLFRPGVKAGPFMNKLLMKALRRKHLSFIDDGMIKSLTAPDLDSFVLTPKGLDYMFSAYEVASYAEGPQFVHVSFSQIPGLDRSGPLKGL